MSAALHTARSRRLGAVAFVVALGAIGTGTTVATIDSGPRAVFVPITPCRIMDTRTGADNVGSRNTPLGANETHTIQTLGTNGNCTIPSDAVGLTMNVAVINPTANSFLTVFPSGVTRPLAANLNWTAGDAPKSNAVTVDIGDHGAVSFYNLTGTVDLAADVVGYYAGHTHDERYAKAEQTLRIDGRLLQVPSGNGFTVHGCPTSSSTMGVSILPLSLPVGAAVRQVRVTMLDGLNVAPYTIDLYRSSTNVTAMDLASIATASGGALSTRTITHVMTPNTPEVVADNETFYLAVVLGTTAFNNGLCQVSVDYDLTP